MCILLQETVAALMSAGGQSSEPVSDVDGIPILDNRPIDFSGGQGLDGIPLDTVNDVSSSNNCCMVHIAKFTIRISLLSLFLELSFAGYI